MQPKILDISLKMLLCRSVLDKKYTLEDSYIKCSDDYYLHTILPINIFIFLVFGVFIPLFLWNILKTKSLNKELDSIASKRVFGYFYLELKTDMYYWDILLMAIVNLNLKILCTYSYFIEFN